MLRRSFLLGSTALAGCATFSANFKQGITDALNLANGLETMLANLGPLNIVGSDLLAQIGTYVADIKGFASSLQGSWSDTSAAPLVQQIEDTFNKILAALGSVPLPPPISTIVAAAQVIIPFIEAAVGLVIPASQARAKAVGMSVDQARQILSNAATQRK